MSELKPYREMIDTGVLWFGQVPSHWQIQRGKSLFIQTHLDVREDDKIVTCFRDGQVTLRSNRRARGFMVALKEVGYQGVRKGQLVIHAMDAFAGAVGISDSNGKCTPEYIVCNARNVNIIPDYFARTLRLAAHQRYIEVACSAVRERAPRLRFPNFGEMLLPVPPVQEQMTIVKYVAHLDRKINRYIGAKNKLIKLLEEERRVIIQGAVTRGLDPNARLKPSGVKWLDDVPEHWTVRRLRHIVDMRVSNVDKHSIDGEIPVRLCNYVDVYKNDSITDNLPFMRATALPAEIERFSLRVGDVLITKDSEAWNDIGVPALVEYAAEDLLCGYHLALLRPLEGLDGRFLFRALQSRSVAFQFHVEANGVTRYGLSHAAIKSIWLPIPPHSEQILIGQFISDATKGISSAINRAKNEIPLLREFRTRLVADVVTGKLDVREAAKLLPEEAPELDPLDEIDDLKQDKSTAEDVELEAEEAA